MTPDVGIEPGPHRWEASALTTAPSLHPSIVIVVVLLTRAKFFFEIVFFTRVPCGLAVHGASFHGNLNNANLIIFPFSFKSMKMEKRLYFG